MRFKKANDLFFCKSFFLVVAPVLILRDNNSFGTVFGEQVRLLDIFEEVLSSIWHSSLLWEMHITCPTLNAIPLRYKSFRKIIENRFKQKFLHCRGALSSMTQIVLYPFQFDQGIDEIRPIFLQGCLLYATHCPNLVK